jgi:hypothetical protein
MYEYIFVYLRTASEHVRTFCVLIAKHGRLLSASQAIDLDQVRECDCWKYTDEQYFTETSDLSEWTIHLFETIGYE